MVHSERLRNTVANGPLPDNIEAQVERWEEERIQALAALSDGAPVNNG